MTMGLTMPASYLVWYNYRSITQLHVVHVDTSHLFNCWTTELHKIVSLFVMSNDDVAYT